MGAIQAVIAQHKLKLPKLAMPLRMIVFGRAQTPNLGPVLALAEKNACWSGFRSTGRVI